MMREMGHACIELSPVTVRRLDAVRALAAIYVVALHVVPGLPVGGFGSVGVIVFFLLSGFVIHANEEQRARIEPLRYLGRRARRLYPVLIVALGVSAAVAVGKGALGSVISASSLAQLLGTLTFQQGITGPFMQNAPLWSLSYEAVYYVVYPLMLLVPGRCRLPTVTMVAVSSLVMFAVNPQHYFWVGTYLLIWWVGVEAARLHGTAASWRKYLPAALSLGLLVAAAAVATTALPLHPTAQFIGRGVVPTGAPSMLLDELSVALGILGVVVLAPEDVKRLFDRAFGWLAVFAPISYGLYVLHFPIVTISDSMPVRLLICVPLTFLLAWLAESSLRRNGWLISASRRTLAQLSRPAVISPVAVLEQVQPRAPGPAQARVQDPAAVVSAEARTSAAPATPGS